MRIDSLHDRYYGHLALVIDGRGEVLEMTSDALRLKSFFREIVIAKVEQRLFFVDNNDNFEGVESQKSRPMLSTATASVSKPSKAIELRKMARNYKYGRNGFEKNYEKALELYKQVYAIDQRGRDAYEVGRIYLWQKPWRSLELAMEWLDIAMEDECYLAHQTLSTYYQRDLSARDGEKATHHAMIAVEWYRSAITLSTLASAQAFNGQFGKAIKTQTEALEIAYKKKAHPNYIKYAEEKLEEYKQKKEEGSE